MLPLCYEQKSRNVYLGLQLNKNAIHRNISESNSFLFTELIFCFNKTPGIVSFDSWPLNFQVTSPLTHNISGTAKAAAQTVMATQWNAEVKTR